MQVRKAKNFLAKLFSLSALWFCVILSAIYVKDMPIWTVGGILAVLGMVLLGFVAILISIAILD